MQVKITGHHLEITSSLKDYVNEKMQRLDSHLDIITGTSVTLTVEKLRHIAKVNLSVKGGMLHAEAEASDMYAAIDGLIDKLNRQVVKYKEKLQAHGE